jgi:hypothetical protein
MFLLYNFNMMTLRVPTANVTICPIINKIALPSIAPSHQTKISGALLQKPQIYLGVPNTLIPTMQK